MNSHQKFNVHVDVSRFFSETCEPGLGKFVAMVAQIVNYTINPITFVKLLGFVSETLAHVIHNLEHPRVKVGRGKVNVLAFVSTAQVNGLILSDVSERLKMRNKLIKRIIHI